MASAAQIDRICFYQTYSDVKLAQLESNTSTPERVLFMTKNALLKSWKSKNQGPPMAYKN